MVSAPEPPNDSAVTTDRTGERGEWEGYAAGLGNRQVQMIAMGGAIGVGLFLGAGGLLKEMGPGIILSYLGCGIAVFFVMRALGELVLYRPVSGSFVEYAREFIGPWAGFAAGWMYWVNWVGSGVAEITAAGIYIGKWFPQFPQWITALLSLLVLLVVNLLSVRLFGELEFWFSVVKVLAIISFLVVGVWLVATGAQVGETTAGVSNLFEHGGFLPMGLPVVLMSLQGVIFAYASMEMAGIAAGETRNPAKVMPRAINSVIARIALFYVGSLLLLCMVLPWTAYSGAESPFVTVFSSIGIPWAGDIMNFVVLTAALSSCNSGLYSTGRILRSLSLNGEAPSFTARMNAQRAPYGAVLFTAAVFLLGVLLNYAVPDKAFEIATSISSLGVIATWAALLYSQLRMRRLAELGQLRRPSYRMPGSPYTNWVVLGFLALVLVLAGFSSDVAARWSLYAVPLLIVAIWFGWSVVRRRSGASEQG
ncbi:MULTISPECIES: amino acid permease [Actinopolyspora]|uniref:L-asparagine permease n=1 Tax=Actinopolyspora saharensis TaxID=995062 RepID=A0A1H0Y3E4_9ACTN|nr:MULTISPECIES: amino acid permease [Actinopolyspora]NHD17501.1 amino acid permease [Actinopolyspora sp. BKK2]NHE76766.1 amino acid permease [Actinopolyspora sp. BKK1]SDQ09615.1 L-asparagine permease [Actinopolyspora saharensis]